MLAEPINSIIVFHFPRFKCKVDVTVVTSVTVTVIVTVLISTCACVRVLDIVIKPFNIKLTLVFEFKYKSGGLTYRDWRMFVDKLRRSFEFGYRDEHGNYYLKRNVIPILVGYAPRQTLAQIGMEGGIVIQGWALENYLKGKMIWSSVNFALMPKYTPSIKVGGLEIPVINVSHHPVLREAAKWLKEHARDI